jgi:hypothetical protein
MPSVNTDRKISETTLACAERLAFDPASPPGLREFHRKQLEDLRKQIALQNKPQRASPFSRFAEYIERHPNSEN